MSDNIEAIVLGIVQGLTEFLPVSSSGHLELFKLILGNDSLSDQSLLITVLLHFATALATMFVFRKDIIEIIKSIFSKEDNSGRQFALHIIISMIPAGIIGFLFDDLIDELFNQQLVLVGICLIVTACLLFWSQRHMVDQIKPIKSLSALIIGLSQAVAILPGISRSGSTIATALLLDIDRAKAARFSFLMVIPLIFGKMAKDAISGDFSQNMPSVSYTILGFAAAFMTGVWACSFMIKIVKNARLNIFAVYCAAIGIIAVIYGIANDYY